MLGFSSFCSIPICALPASTLVAEEILVSGAVSGSTGTIVGSVAALVSGESILSSDNSTVSSSISVLASGEVIATGVQGSSASSIVVLVSLIGVGIGTTGASSSEGTTGVSSSGTCTGVTGVVDSVGQVFVIASVIAEGSLGILGPHSLVSITVSTIGSTTGPYAKIWSARISVISTITGSVLSEFSGIVTGTSSAEVASAGGAFGLEGSLTSTALVLISLSSTIVSSPGVADGVISVVTSHSGIGVCIGELGSAAGVGVADVSGSAELISTPATLTEGSFVVSLSGTGITVGSEPVLSSTIKVRVRCAGTFISENGTVIAVGSCYTTVPGAEYALGMKRSHYVIPASKSHYRLEPTRPYWFLPRVRANYALPLKRAHYQLEEE